MRNFVLDVSADVSQLVNPILFFGKMISISQVFQNLPCTALQLTSLIGYTFQPTRSQELLQLFYKRGRLFQIIIAIPFNHQDKIITSCTLYTGILCVLNLTFWTNLQCQCPCCQSLSDGKTANEIGAGDMGGD